MSTGPGRGSMLVMTIGVTLGALLVLVAVLGLMWVLT
jgi:hypothetical protein